MAKEIKYTDNVLWLRPFVDSVKSLVPLEKITRIRGYKVKLGLKTEAQGRSIQQPKRKINLSILLWEQSESKKTHLRRFYYHVLETLAHELAHVVCWEHDTEHFRLTAQILIKFSDVIEQEGITDTSHRVSKELIHKYIEEELERKRSEQGEKR